MHTLSRAAPGAHPSGASWPAPLDAMGGLLGSGRQAATFVREAPVRPPPPPPPRVRRKRPPKEALLAPPKAPASAPAPKPLRAYGPAPHTLRGGVIEAMCALRREQPEQASFHVEDLVVRCWEMFPERYGMKRHALPNVTAVTSKLPGLVKERWLSHVSASEYTLGTRGPMWRCRNRPA